MKRIIRAADETANGWKREWDDEFGESYYIKEKNGLKAIISWKDNDGDGYYWARVFQPGQPGRLGDKYLYPFARAQEWADNFLDEHSEAVTSCDSIIASYDSDDESYITYNDVYDDFISLEDEVFTELGIYVDFSSVRGDYGTLFIYADPTQECNSDVWDGDEDAFITRVEFEDYTDDVERDVLSYPEEEWKARLKDYVETLIS